MRTSAFNLPTDASACKRSRSAASCNTVLSCTFLTFGTSSPDGVSIAIPMLCDALKMISVPSAEIDELSNGKSEGEKGCIGGR